MFSTLYGTYFSFQMHFKMSSVICLNLDQSKISHRPRYIHLSLASHSMKYSQFSFGLTPSFSSKHHVQSGITDKRHSHFLISYYRLISQSNLFRLVPYSLQRMQYETSLDQKETTLTSSIKRVRHLEYTEEIYRTVSIQ